MNIELNIDKKVFNDAYFPYVTDYAHKFEVIMGGSGSGKSHFIAQKLIIKACSYKRKVLVIRKTQVSQKESCWRLILNILSDWNISQYCSVNKSDMTIELPNGSVFLFKGLDDPEKIKSITGITDCWVEEATELTLDDFDQLTLRLRERVDNTQFFISFNPISKVNWVYKMWFAPEAKVGEDTLIVKTTYKDNKFLPPDYVKTLENKINTNPTYYKIYALGEFCSLDKLVFNNWEVRELPDFQYNETIFGLDFGYVNDPSAFIAAKVNTTTKELYVFDEMYKSGMLNNEIAGWIRQKGYSKELIIADSAEQKSIEEIKRAGIYRIRPAWKGKGSVLTGIDTLQQYKIYVHPDCENFITELNNYSWKKDKHTSEYMNEPNDNFNHLCDALRYGIQKLSVNGLKTMNKKILGL